MHRHFLAAAILATLLVSASSSEFDFYMLSLLWPTSVCSTQPDYCKSPIPNIFTIHGFWPTFADGTQVPPYNKDKNNCNVNPTSPDLILEQLQPIENRLHDTWPNLWKGKQDIDYWKVQWKRHGMCSEYPQDPYGYLNAALILAESSKYNPLQVMGIEPSDQTEYSVKQILENVNKVVGKYPQIKCNKLDGKLQLRELRFCFNKGESKNPPSVLRDCPMKVDGQDCTQETDTVKFPPAISLEYASS